MSEVSRVSNFLLDFISISKRFKNNRYYIVCCQTFAKLSESSTACSFERELVIITSDMQRETAPNIKLGSFFIYMKVSLVLSF